MNILHRIWKARFHYFLVLPALLLIAVFKVIPFLTALHLPFVDFQMTKGIRGSAWVGMTNFKMLFEDPVFHNALVNTLVIKMEYIIACGILAFILALALSGIKSTKLRDGFSTLFLIPYFIPSVVVAYLVMLVLSENNNPFFELDELLLSNESLFQPLLVGVEVVKTCGIPVMMALAAMGAKQVLSAGDHSNSTQGNHFSRRIVIPAARAIAAFMLLQLATLLTTDFELVNKLLNPLVFQTGETLATYSFRNVFMNGNYNTAGTLWLFQFLVQLFFTLLAYFLIRGIFTEDLFTKQAEASPKPVDNHKTNHPLGWGVALLYCLVILVPIFLLFVYPFLAKSHSELNLGDLLAMSRFGSYFLVNLAAVFIFLLITLTLAYPLTRRDLPGRGAYKIFLLIVLLMGGGLFHEFMFVKSFGMINTIFPQLFYGFFSIASVFVLKGIFNSKYSALKEQASIEGRGELHSFFYLFIPKIWKPLLALGILQFVCLWNSYLPAFIYTSHIDQYSPVMFFQSLSSGGEQMGIDFSDPLLLQYGAFISLPSVLLLLIFRKLITSEVLLGQTNKL